MRRVPGLGGWTTEEIRLECRAAWGPYRRLRTEQYTAYFSAHPELKDPGHDYKARDLSAALPDAWAELADDLPVGERHPQHLSANSSQVLALGLLGVARKRDPTLAWLQEALSPLPSAPGAAAPPSNFEFKLAPEVLGEQPRQTSVDFCVRGSSSVICVECKWTEDGLGICSCSAPAPLTGGCSEQVLSREAYWDVAYNIFHLPQREHGHPCPLSPVYQAVRNVAARSLSSRLRRFVSGFSEQRPPWAC